MSFKKGDVITCTKASGTFIEGELKLGKDYIVEDKETDSNLVGIIDSLGKHSFYSLSRFHLSNRGTMEKVKIPKPVARMTCVSVANFLKIKIEFIEIGTNYLMLRFISDTFANVPHKHRQNVIMDAFNSRAEKIIDQYEILFEAYTPRELDMMRTE